MSGQDSDFYRTLTMVIVALGVFFVIIIVAANMVSSDHDESKLDPRIKAKIDESIKPVAKVEVEASAPAVAAAAPAPTSSAAAAPVAAASGYDAAGGFQTKCFACHGTGAAGAPKVGDKAAWTARIASGDAAMLKNAIDGKGAMPPKGGASDLSDDQIKSIVTYMVNKSK